jgi:hypothetical protein
MSRCSALRRLAGAVLAVPIALVLVGLAATRVAADDGIFDTASTTYEVDPAAAVIHVSIDKRITNSIVPSSRAVECTRRVYRSGRGWTSVRGTCRQAIDSYVDSAYVWVEKGARDLQFSTTGGTVGHAVDRSSANFTAFRLTFPRVHEGQSRTVQINYDLAGGAPRSEDWTRVGWAYVSFCAVPNGYDQGDLQVIVPTSYAVTVQPTEMMSRTDGTRLVFASGDVTDTADYYRCFEGTDPSGYTRDTFNTASGHVVVIESWPEDGAWRDALRREVTASLGALERLIGSPLPTRAALRVREVTASELGYYAGTYDAADTTARVSEDFDQPGLVAHELAHAWFNRTSLASRWLSEGLAQWAEQASPSRPAACPEPGPYPESGPIDLDAWPAVDPKSGQDQRDLADYDYAASCWIMRSISDRISTTRMSAVVQAVLANRAIYGEPAVSRRPGVPADWREFLDAVDELGMVPVGAGDYHAIEQLLLRFGVVDEAQVAHRAEARAAYHELQADPSGWDVPAVVRSELEDWQWASALTDAATASGTLELAWAADRAVDIGEPLGGPVRAAYEASRSSADLEAAEALAQAQADAARDLARSFAVTDASVPGSDAADGPAFAAYRAARSAADFRLARAVAAGQAAAAREVASALALMDSPRDTLTSLGLTSGELEAARAVAIEAIHVADPAAALAAAARIRYALGGAADTGRSRVITTAGAVAAGAIAVVAGLVVVVRRRRRNRPIRASGPPPGSS